MAGNLKHTSPSPASRVNASSAAAVSSGQLFSLEGDTGLVALALVDIAAGGTGAATIDGVVEYTKATGAGAGFAQGDKVFFDSALDELTNVNTFKYAGIAYEAAGDNDAKAKIVLNRGLHA